MAPQPLSKLKNQITGIVYIQSDSLAKRPKQAALVAQIIGLWSHIDHTLAMMTTNFLQADFEAVINMLQALRSSDGRRAAITAAAKSTLSPDDFVIYEIVMKIIKPSRDRRNEFAHHLWGHADGLDDALLLINPKYLAEHHAKSEAVSLQRIKQIFQYDPAAQPPEQPMLDWSQFFVFRGKDIKKDLVEAQSAYQMVFTLRFVLSNHPASAAMRSELLNLPQVQQALQDRSSESDQ